MKNTWHFSLNVIWSQSMSTISGNHCITTKTPFSASVFMFCLCFWNELALAEMHEIFHQTCTYSFLGLYLLNKCYLFRMNTINKYNKFPTLQGVELETSYSCWKTISREDFVTEKHRFLMAEIDSVLKRVIYLIGSILFGSGTVVGRDIGFQVDDGRLVEQVETAQVQGVAANRLDAG